MRVVCLNNNHLMITRANVRERLGRLIHLDGPNSSLIVGQEYAVQAIGEMYDALWFYLHTVPEVDCPYPYPAEMFELRDGTVPAGWKIALQLREGNACLKLLSFEAWVTDDTFYERLVDDDPGAVATYRRFKEAD